MRNSAQPRPQYVNLIGRLLQFDDGEIVPIGWRIDEVRHLGTEDQGVVVDELHRKGEILADDDVIGLLVQSRGFCFVFLLDRFVEQLVDFRVAVPADIEAVRRMVVATRHHLGPERNCPAPADLVHLQLIGHALEPFSHIGDPLDLVEFARGYGMTGIGIKQSGPHASRFLHMDDLEDGVSGPRPWIWSYR